MMVQFNNAQMPDYGEMSHISNGNGNQLQMSVFRKFSMPTD